MQPLPGVQSVAGRSAKNSAPAKKRSAARGCLFFLLFRAAPHLTKHQEETSWNRKPQPSKNKLTPSTHNTNRHCSVVCDISLNKRVVKGIFVTRDRPVFFLVKREMAIFFLVNREFHSGREAWFCKIIFRETRNKCLIRREPWFSFCLCYLHWVAVTLWLIPVMLRQRVWMVFRLFRS